MSHVTEISQHPLPSKINADYLNQRKYNAMKKPPLVFSLLLSTTIFSSLSFGEWRLSVESEVTHFYWDPETIKKIDGLVYSWFLLDYQEESTESDSLSMMINVEIDCQTLASKDLSYVSYKQHMAGGFPSRTDTPKSPEIVFHPMITPRYRLTKVVCDSVNFD